MRPAFFFGYGSLVNRHTHRYDAAHAASVRGWRRAWRYTPDRQVAYLTAVRDADCRIDGLVAHVPGGNWAALDLREEGYARHAIAGGLTVEGDVPVAAQVYAVAPHTMVVQADPAPILLSYLDVVVQGYLREFGEQGARDFFATTDGWDTPVLNDRAAPRYPRAQVLTGAETALVDALLAAVGGRVI